MKGIDSVVRSSFQSVKKAMANVPNRILNKPVVNLTAADCARMGREVLKTGDKFGPSISPLSQGLTPEVCKSGKTYAAAVNESIENAKLLITRMFTKKGAITKEAKEFMQLGLEMGGFKPNVTIKQIITKMQKIFG